jgi:hypothetical protein
MPELSAGIDFANPPRDLAGLLAQHYTAQRVVKFQICV